MLSYCIYLMILAFLGCFCIFTAQNTTQYSVATTFCVDPQRDRIFTRRAGAYPANSPLFAPGVSKTKVWPQIVGVKKTLIKEASINVCYYRNLVTMQYTCTAVVLVWGGFI